MMQISRLYKSVGGTQLLRDISIEIPSGQVLGVIGASGSGKTSLLMCLSGLAPFDAGEIQVNGCKLDAGQSKKTTEQLWLYRRQFGLVFQSLNLFPHLTVLENITEAPVHVLGMEKSKAEELAMLLLGKLEMEEHAEKYPEELSGGEQQRVAILRSLAMKPSVILLDEPTSALDPKKSADVRNLIREYVNEGHTLIIVSHSVKFLRGIADTLVFVDKGEIIEAGTTEQILQNPRDPRLVNYLSHIESA